MKRMMVLVPLVALAVSGCSDQPKLWRQSEIEEIANERAEDFADAGVVMVEDDFGARINQLEQRIDDLEQENRDLESRISTLEIYQ